MLLVRVVRGLGVVRIETDRPAGYGGNQGVGDARGGERGGEGGGAFGEVRPPLDVHDDDGWRDRASGRFRRLSLVRVRYPSGSSALWAAPANSTATSTGPRSAIASTGRSSDALSPLT